MLLARGRLSCRGCWGLACRAELSTRGQSRYGRGIWPGDAIPTASPGAGFREHFLILPIVYLLAVASLRRPCSHTRRYINQLLISSATEIPASLWNGSAEEANPAGGAREDAGPRHEPGRAQGPGSDRGKAENSVSTRPRLVSRRKN